MFLRGKIGTSNLSRPYFVWMKENRTYWFCQAAGWFGMVAIETINYTFFIIGKFNASVFWAMIAYAIIGIISTHVYRLIIRKKHIFEKKTIHIWISALLSTLTISGILSLANFLPGMIADFSFFLKNVKFIEIAGTIINWMRYVGVWVIIYFMYKILEHRNAIQQEKLTLENLAKTTELELLKLQLNPHFLFNALNSIKALVTINPDVCRDAIVKLSELLRFTLQYGKEQLIPLSDEIAEVKKYLELEQLRFGKRLKVTYQIDENTFSQTIPPAIVLTLAENAVKHGAAQQINESNITVALSIEEGQLVIRVLNTGEYAPSRSNGIGLKHIRKRLEEVYHHHARFSIHQENEQVVATLQTPLSWQ